MPAKSPQTVVAPASSDAFPVLPSINPTLRDALEADIVARGIICPIVVSSDGQILDGRLREEIGRRHGLFVPRVVVGCLDAGEKTDIRLVLNGLRRHLSQAQSREIVAWELRRAPERSDRSIAAKIGVSHNTVASTRRSLEGNGSIDHCSKRTAADGRDFPSRRKPIVITGSDRHAEEASRLLENVGDELPGRHITFRKLRFAAHQKDRDERTAAARPVELGDGIEIFCLDFRDLGNRVGDGSASLCLLDPPWGTGDAHLRQPLAETAFRLAMPGSYAAVYSGTAGIGEFIKIFESVGWIYRWLVVGERHMGVLRNNGAVHQRFAPILIFQRPPGKFITPGVLSDRIESPGMEKELHAWAQPRHESRLMVQAFTLPGQLVVDLTCGSGTSGVGTIEAGGARRYAGVEIDRKMVLAARERLAAALRKK